MLWDLQELRANFVEKHLDSTKLSDLQRDAVSDLLKAWVTSNIIEVWIVSTETKESQSCSQYKAIFTGGLLDKWKNLSKVGKTMRKNQETDGFLLGEMDKCQLGCNYMQLIVDTLREINEKAIFFDNIKEVDELLCAVSECSRIWDKIITMIIRKNKGSDCNGLDYLGNSGILLVSIMLNYRKLIAEETEHATRKVIDLFF